MPCRKPYRKLHKTQGELFTPDEIIQDPFFFEHQAFNKGAKLVAGIDEAGRGPLSGPVVAAAVIFPPGESPVGINDSKKLSPKKREKLFVQILEHALSVGVGYVEPSVIDKINILRATTLAMKYAVKALDMKPDHVLIDGYHVKDFPIPQTAIVKGDSLSVSIGAASIVAKVVRDRMMTNLAKLYPEYGFDKNNGYATRFHLAAIKEHGSTPVHRKTFRGVKEYNQ